MTGLLQDGLDLIYRRALSSSALAIPIWRSLERICKRRFAESRDRTHGRKQRRCPAGCNYFGDVDLVKSGFDGEHTESNHRLMYT